MNMSYIVYIDTKQATHTQFFKIFYDIPSDFSKKVGEM